MSKYIILYRHGIAEDKTEYENDSERPLSIRGKNVLKKSTPGFKTMLGNHENFIIYTSPLLRATQTADTLAGYLGTGEPKIRDFLATGGHVSLLKKLLEDVDPGDVVIVVGHQPYLSVWSQELSGFFLPFKKGTAACYKYPDIVTEEKAEIRWYLQSRDFIKIQNK